MDLHTFFEYIAPALDTDAATLTAYANEDAIGGFHPDPALSKWIVGSIWEIEGKALYAIVRALKPKRVLEIGTRAGCSTTHLLTALEANGEGEMVSIDLGGYIGAPMPEALAARWTFAQSDALEWLKKNRKTFTMVFEDGPHDYEFTRNALAMLEKVKPSLVVSHDAEHYIVGEDIRRAWTEVYGAEYSTALIAPSDCGLAWKFVEGG